MIRFWVLTFRWFCGRIVRTSRLRRRFRRGKEPASEKEEGEEVGFQLLLVIPNCNTARETIRLHPKWTNRPTEFPSTNRKTTTFQLVRSEVSERSSAERSSERERERERERRRREGGQREREADGMERETGGEREKVEREADGRERESGERKRRSNFLFFLFLK